MELNEPVSIVYKNDRITMKSKSFTATLSISGSELSKIYWGNEGKGTVKLQINEVALPKAKPVDVAEAEKKSEPVEQKQNTNAPVQRTTASVRKPVDRKPRASTTSNDDFMKNFGK